MTLSNAEILARLDNALKTITVTDFGKSVLVPEQFDRFVRAMQHRTSIINEARFIRMDSQTTHVDRVGFVGRILKSGGAVVAGVQQDRVLAEAEYAKPQFDTNIMVARELQAVCAIKDTALRRNIERAGFENTLVDLFGEAAGRDMEEYAMLADTGITHANDDVLSLTDGWVRLSVNRVFGQPTAGPPPVPRDFDPAATDWPENMFQAMLMALPKQYLQNRAEWRYYVDFDVEDAYRNLLRKRGTELGDAAQIEARDLRFKGIPVTYAPLIGRARGVNVTNRFPGRVAMLSHPDNLAWGIFHEVTVEPERHAKGRMTEFVLTLEADSHFEDENANVVAFIDLARGEYWG
jgi:hypothetical protein